MAGDILLAAAVIGAMTVTAWVTLMGNRASLSRLRARLEGQGFTVERLTPAAPNVVTLVNDQYGRSRYVSRRVYDVLVNDHGVHLKQLWMIENGRIVRIS